MESSLGKNPQSDENDKSQIINKPIELNAIEELFFKLLRRKKILLITLISFLIFGLIRTTKEKIFNPLYEGTFTLLIEDPINQSTRNINTPGAYQIFDTSSNQLEQDIPTLRKLLLSEYILGDLAIELNVDYKEISRKVRIDQDSQSPGVLEVILVSNNPKEDLNLLNKLSEVFVNYAIVQKQKKLSDGLSFLNAQEPAIKEKNIELRIKLENFMKKNNLINPVDESSNKKNEIKLIEKSIAELKTKNKRLATIKEEVLKDNLNATRYSEIIGDIQSSSLQIGILEAGVSKQYESLNKQLGEAQLIYTPSSSIIKNIKSRIELLRPIVKEKQLEAIEKSIKSTQNIIELKEITLLKLNNEFKKLTSLIREYEVLDFELQAASANLTGLNTVKEKLQLQIAQDSKPWTIIKDPSFNSIRIYPSFRKELTNFALMGIGLGVLLCLLREKFDDVFHSPDEIQNEINLPLLGHIPHIKFFENIREEKRSILEAFTEKKEDQVINSYDKFFYQEALRNIYTSIRFMNSDNPIEVITITSSVSKEGKSLTSILLAKTLSEMDLRILQIDADLRKPQLHSRLGLNNITGLSNIITNEEIKISDAIQNVPGFPNWNVITSGTKPPDPTRLLQSKKMDNIVSTFKRDKKYDLVLIDTPPVIGLADSLLVSEKSDGLILIVTTNQVPRGLPKESINKCLKSGASLLGIISNSTNKEANQLFTNYSYKYGYGYGYGNYSYTYNSYAEEEKENKTKTIKKTKLDKIKSSLLTNSKKIIKIFFKWLDA